MVDHKKSIGTQDGSYMMIRDTGSVVEFYVRSGSPYTWAQSFPFSWVVNGSSGSGTASYNYPYSGWSGSPTTPGPLKKIKSFTVSRSQYVTFNLGATGTTGLNGPSTFKVYIDRADKPSRPLKPVLSEILHMSIRVKFSDPANNGATIDDRQLGWGNSSTSPTIYSKEGLTDRDRVVSGLTPGTQYYFFVRVHNSEGWSAWSPAATARTLSAAQIKVGTDYKHAIPYVRVAGVWKLMERWSNNKGTWER